MLARGRGDVPPSRVRQGYLVALTLFLFLVEAMSTFLIAQDTGLQGLCLPVREVALIDFEFIDEMIQQCICMAKRPTWFDFKWL